ncbi:MAG: RluA family pseudouridine synthase [bacterium]|nr:RluA family pseudouridine synthase [bacterium]
MNAAAERIELVCDDGAPRLDAYLAAQLPQFSRSRIQNLIREGHVRVAGMPALKSGERVEAGMCIEIDVPPPEPLTLAPEDIPLEILFEDTHLLVVDKPPDMVVHPGTGARGGTLVAALLHHCRGQLSGIGGVERPGIVHRLDKDTSGLLVVAKTDAAHRRLSADLKARQIRRSYFAIVRGVPAPAEGTIDAPIGRHPRHRTEMTVREGGRTAITHYKVREQFDGAALLEVNLETGRTHQIRVHLRHIGHPVLGDPIYGGARLSKEGRRRKRAGDPLDALIGRQALHAFRLEFVHPVSGEPCVCESGLPFDMEEVLAALRGSPAGGR